MEEKQYLYALEFRVRDYECDLQGVVNNANYLHYLEHTRHEFLKSRGLDFAWLHRQGKDAVVTRVEIDYKKPLTSGDRFVVRLNVDQVGRLRILFFQDIFRLEDEAHIVHAKVTGTLLVNSRPAPVDDIMKMIR